MLSLNSFFRPSIRLLGAIAAVVVAVVALPTLASATIASTTATPFLGESMTATLTIDDESQLGDLVITLRVDAGPLTGDLRGFYAHVADESLLGGLSVTGPDITDSLFVANSVHQLGAGTQVPNSFPGCGWHGCDFGVAIGTFGIEADDIQTVTFVLSHSTMDLTVDLLADLSFAIRLDDVGTPDGDRSSYSKLSGTVAVPEPSTAIMMLLGLAGLTAAGRRSTNDSI